MQWCMQDFIPGERDDMKEGEGEKKKPPKAILIKNKKIWGDAVL